MVYESVSVKPQIELLVNESQIPLPISLKITLNSITIKYCTTIVCIDTFHMNGYAGRERD